jgi:hypothetical protein
MNRTKGSNKSLVLQFGNAAGMLHLVKAPGKGLRIREYECMSADFTCFRAFWPKLTFRRLKEAIGFISWQIRTQLLPVGIDGYSGQATMRVRLGR